MSDLMEVLKEKGLDDQYWLPQFAKLGITSKAALHYLDTEGDDYSTLLKAVRYSWEKKALQNLLKVETITEKEPSKKIKRQEALKQRRAKSKSKTTSAKEEAEKKIKEAKELLQELDKAKSDGKDRQDREVQELESKVLEKLNIAPETWISSDTTLDEVISKTETRLEKSTAAIQSRKGWDDAALIQNISGGRALQGILLTSKTEDLHRERACLLKVPKNISLQGSGGTLKEDVKIFSSKEQEDSYKTTVDILGRSISTSAQAPVYGAVVIGGGVSKTNKTQNEKATKENKQEVYSSTIKFTSLNVASFRFRNRDLQLSEDAKEDLKLISEAVKTASSPNIQKACEIFFHNYGSHVNKGHLKFGGRYLLTCSSKGLQAEDLETAKMLQNEAITVNAGFSFAGFGVSSEVSLNKVEGSYTGKYNKKMVAKTHMRLEIDGGPAEVSDLSVWKAGLVANRSTWVLTDRGNELEAVWDIISRNHKNEFGGLIEVLRKAWEKMTGLQSVPNFQPSLKHNPEDIMNEVTTWLEGELTLFEIEVHLTFLYEIKEDILMKIVNPQYWVDKYLSQSILQEFLLMVVDNDEYSSSMSIKFMMQQIILEKDLKKLSRRTFPDIDDISVWLYGSSDKQPTSTVCESLQGLLDHLKKSLDAAKLALLEAEGPLLGSVGSSQFASIPMATDVSLAIHSLRTHRKGTYDEILVMILSFPFQNSTTGDVITLNPLSIPDLQSLYEKFAEGIETYESAIVDGWISLRLQSFLLYLAVNNNNKQEQQLKRHLKVITELMNPQQLELTLKDELHSYFRGSYSLPQFTKILQCLYRNGELPPCGQLKPIPGKGASLLHVLNSAIPEQGATQPQSTKPASLESSPEAKALFTTLGLAKHYHEKLGLRDALCIRYEPLKMSLNKEFPTEPIQLPFLILQKLTSFDFLSRSDLVSQSNGQKVHPMDSLLALILSSDHFLQQDLFTRMAKCQLAVPFILPDPFTGEIVLPLWAMRCITKEWKFVQTVLGEDKVVEKTLPIIKYPMPIVSFMRLGESKKRGESKSRIANKIISDFDHFFHRDLSGGSCKHVLGDGLVDMCWYLPAGKRGSDVFPDAVTFLNLHGDAREHPKQSRLLSQISSMCFVLLTESELELSENTLNTLQQLSSSVGGLIILQGTTTVPESLTINAAHIKLDNYNAFEVTVKIRQEIRANLFGNNEQYTSIEDHCSWDSVLSNNIHVDECIESFQKGLDQANEVTSLIKQGSSIKRNVKQEMLPLQGEDLWHKWGSLDKESNRLEFKGGKNAYDYVSDIEKQQKDIRNQQFIYVQSLSPMIETFIRSLVTLTDRTTRKFFLQNLIINLNELSGERISGLIIKYQATQEAISKLQPTTGSPESKAKARKENAPELAKLRHDLKKVKEDIVDSSFGLHHLLRELGQVYEAACDNPAYKDLLTQLPMIAAELLLDGYPLELMDGDAAHVPVKWVQAVIKEVSNELDDPKMFVLSVLGLQSTGKSTMLNTVFGLTFSTSAGRCTRGAFMQLLPLDQTIKDDTGYSYILVIDTEGLRTPELDSLQMQKHDNELATFIIGLANITLINISGEVAGDLDDILQTTVHAFLRMNKVKLHPSCQFIHQNSGASAKAQVGRDDFAKQLDSWTINAAREESCVGRYEKFSDVIQFDNQKDVHHFPGLWKGDPPMAPVNQGYSQAAQQIKLNLLLKLHDEINGTFMSSFNERIGSLWGDLLKENFVFSFKNTEEIMAYNLLGAQFNKWEGAIQAEMLDWEKEAANLINSEKDLAKIPIVVEQKRSEITKFVLKIYNMQVQELEKFFRDSKLKGTLVQWKAKFEINLKEVKKEWEAHADNHCIQLGKGRHAIYQFERDRIKYTAKLSSEAQDLIAKMKSEEDELYESLSKRKLSGEQLRKIMKRKNKIFTPEKLNFFKVKGILARRKTCHSLTIKDVEKILTDKEMTPSETKKILNLGRLDEDELKAEFDRVWIKIVNNLPPVYSEVIDVEARVTKKLAGHAKTLEDNINRRLISKDLRQWGKSFVQDFEVQPKHYIVSKTSSWTGKVGNWLYKNVLPMTDPHQIQAQKITESVFEEARQFIEDLKERKTYFNDAYTSSLLKHIDNFIKSKASNFKDKFTFGRSYYVDVYLIICGYAVGEFEQMAEDFKQQNDPRVYLEKYQREPLFTKFKNQYYKTAAEIAIADNLCAALSGPIKAQVESSLGAKIVGQMKCQAYLANKMALKAKILVDLGTNGSFGDYMMYLSDTKRSLKHWIECYTMQYCNDKVSSESDETQLQFIAKKEISRIIILLQRKVQEIQADIAIKWLSTFCDDTDIRKELGVSLSTSDMLPHDIEKLDLTNFKVQMERELCKLKQKLHGIFEKVKCNGKEMAKWREQPFGLLKSLCGCTEQCPFCGEQCDLEEHIGTAVKHSVTQHRPQCVIGWRNADSKIMDLDMCPTNVASDHKFQTKETDHNWHPFKTYTEVYPDWHIPPDPAAKDHVYWKWFVCRNVRQLAKHYGMKVPEIPGSWYELKWEEVKAKLMTQFNL